MEWRRKLAGGAAVRLCPPLEGSPAGAMWSEVGAGYVRVCGTGGCDGFCFNRQSHCMAQRSGFAKCCTLQVYLRVSSFKGAISCPPCCERLALLLPYNALPPLRAYNLM
ncbi:hypothetical protein Vretifemale_6138 [Volvox reticuliferus]|uniref:Uncharacterized protein n=1 Tax=Volvox reticuliferus TaxID=1737510 RepID=A0A8J4FIL0_9CHLO|nr:hypothetical protein Vretifemale_6138 [Volvox reticuliferus]